MLVANRTIKELTLYGTDLIGSRNASDWADTLATNTPLKKLHWNGLSEQSSNVVDIDAIEEDAMAHCLIDDTVWNIGSILKMESF